MKKKDLKTGMIVQLRDKSYGLIYGKAVVILYNKSNINGGGGIDINDYENDLTILENNKYDIVKVFAEHERAFGSGIHFKIEDENNILRYFAGKHLWSRVDKEPETIMTIKEIETLLNIKNLKIRTKEAE